MHKSTTFSDLDQEVMAYYEDRGMSNTIALIDTLREHSGIFFAIFSYGGMNDDQIKLFDGRANLRMFLEGVMCNSFTFGTCDGSSRPIDTFLDLITRTEIDEREMDILENTVALPVAYFIRYGKYIQLGFKYNVVFLVV